MYNNLSWGMLVYDFDKSNKDSLLVVEDRFVWDNHLANPKKENFTQKLLILSQKTTIFLNRKVFNTHNYWKKKQFSKEKVYYTFTKKAETLNRYLILRT